jgi:peptide/nickel transport system permease protein
VTTIDVWPPPAPGAGRVRHQVARDYKTWLGAGVLVALALWAVVGPWLAPWDAQTSDTTAFNQPPGARHWFGTNAIGQDLYQQVLVGLRKSLVIGLAAGLLATTVAAVVGSVAGLVGGWVDRLLVTGIDLLLVLPSFYLLMLASPAVTGARWPLLAVFIAAFTWMVTARLVRAQTRTLREQGFVRSARFAGAPTWWVAVRHVWPNLASVLVADMTLGVGAAVLTEATMTYFGIGVRIPDVSLGTLLSAGSTAVTARPWLFFFPAGVLVTMVLAVSLLGDALRDALAAGGRRG